MNIGGNQCCHGGSISNPFDLSIVEDTVQGGGSLPARHWLAAAKALPVSLVHGAELCSSVRDIIMVAQ